MSTLFKNMDPTADTNGFDAVETGAVAEVTGYDLPIGLLFSGTFVATLKVEVSYDGTNWAQFGADVTAVGTVKIDIPVKQVRVRCSAYTSGAAHVGLGAINSTRDDE